MTAAFGGHVDVVRELLGAGANPDAQDESGLTALTNTVLASADSDVGPDGLQFVEVLEALLEAGADTEIVDHDGSTVVDHARVCGVDDLLALLEGLEVSIPES